MTKGKSKDSTIGPGKVPVDVRIVNIADIPPQYFLHHEVTTALRAVIRSDVVVYGKPVPPGAEAVFGEKSDVKAQAANLKIHTRELARQVRLLIPGLLAIAFIVAVISAAVYFVMRAL